MSEDSLYTNEGSVAILEERSPDTSELDPTLRPEFLGTSPEQKGNSLASPRRSFIPFPAPSASDEDLGAKPTKQEVIPGSNNGLEELIPQGNYLLEVNRVLGQGGLGRVESATARYRPGSDEDKPRKPQKVAVKTALCNLNQAAADSALEQEVRVYGLAQKGRKPTSRLPRPIAYIPSKSGDQNSMFLLEQIDGQSLKDMLRGGLGDYKQRLLVMYDVLSGLEELHRRRIAHLDLKPANIMIDERGRAKVLDLGLSRILDDEGEDTRISGTPEYSPPEQIRKGRSYLGLTADTYAVRLLFIEMCADPEKVAAAAEEGIVLPAGFSKYERRSKIRNDHTPSVPFPTRKRKRGEDVAEGFIRAEREDFSYLGDGYTPLSAMLQAGLQRDPKERQQDTLADIKAMKKEIATLYVLAD